ncbi:PhoD-like phosphatase [Alkalinema sp. FACHB-956]|uniref:PhoD-like phosphatase n=1 Tax=Alkalinema sp. FACHB-956 TaxID=2692768 RepID=UPI001687413F|nr:PhoD-like phosphatase [Alkalinema sp. FACHB-956]MBD2326049.1 PhoD-like phosphatase [Alkalinema sp. FACHB-956]
MTDRVASLPLILAGPILQHTDPESVTVWVALKAPRQVTLRIYATSQNGAGIESLRMEGQRSTVPLGQFLHVVAVTATSTVGDQVSDRATGSLKAGEVYAYDLDFQPLDSPEGGISPNLRSNHRSVTLEGSVTLEDALCSPAFPAVTISYFDHRLPTFALPPQELDNLRLVHGSCRKPHGDGVDALATLDDLIDRAIGSEQPRPHQLWLTGDQIYGDDVADPLLWVATQVGDDLLGWREALQLRSKAAAAKRSPSNRSLSNRPPADCTSSPIEALEPLAAEESEQARTELLADLAIAEELRPGTRSQVATKAAGFTAGLLKKSHKVNSHLLSLGEFYAAYLLAWSPICWITQFPTGADQFGRSSSRKVDPHRTAKQAAKQWDREVRDIQAFIHSLWKVRRAIANVPMYCIFDDHDVSDDWYLNQAWCLRVLSKPLGRRAVQNALLAYAVFQGWGNTPDRFAAGQLGEQLLQAAAQWSASQGQDAQVWERLGQLLGMPQFDRTGVPIFVRDGDMWVLSRHPDALPWHYRLQSPCHDVIVLDTRTWRGYPIAEKIIAPPTLLSPSAFQEQLQKPLQEISQQPLNPEVSKTDSTRPTRITFLIAPTNLFGLQAIDWIQHWYLRQNKVFAHDVGDAWNIRLPALANLLTTLLNQDQSVVVLSGDIHYGAAVALDYYPLNPAQASHRQLVQLTSSALKNEELITRLIQTRLKQWLLPERDRLWIGWQDPIAMMPVAKVPNSTQPADRPFNDRSLNDRPVPDWYCKLAWIRPRPPQRVGRVIGLEAPQPGRSEVTHRRFWGNRLRRWLVDIFAPLNHWFQAGSEVIGHNNLGHVQVRWDAAQQQFIVTQDLYWRRSTAPSVLVCSRFCTSTHQPDRGKQL